jgi:hypothetical protein
VATPEFWSLFMRPNMRHVSEAPILFVNFSATWGGGEQWHLTTARELLRRGYFVTIVARAGGRWPQRPRSRARHV